MGGLRVRKNGERTHVISPTVSDEAHKAVRRMAVEYGSTMSATVRVAIELGLVSMMKASRERDDVPSRFERIEGMLAKDGRRTEGN